MIAKLLRRLAGCTLGNLLYAAASMLPRDERLWLFGAWNGRKFLDNPKHIFQFVLASCPDIRAVWICKDRLLQQSLTAAGLPAEYAWSPRGIFFQLRAAVVVYTHEAPWEFLAYLLGHRVRRVQTWHGTPIKKIGYDDRRHGDQRRKMRLVRRIFWYEDNRCDLILVASETERTLMAGAFTVRPENVRITGYPRNDAIVRSAMRGLRQSGSRTVIYMPTYRGDVGAEFRLFAESGFDFRKVDSFCAEHDIDFYIKLHPVQVFAPGDRAAIDASDRLHAVENVGDIYESIGDYDALITDFSGIFFDFLITGRPIVMAPINFDSYLANDRELYYSYDELCAEKPCRDWDAVLERLRALRGSGDPGHAYRALQSRFHRYLDDGSARRAVTEIRRLATGRAP